MNFFVSEFFEWFFSHKEGKFLTSLDFRGFRKLFRKTAIPSMDMHGKYGIYMMIHGNA